MPRIYQETFDRGTGGWWGFAGNHLGLQPLGWRRGEAQTRIVSAINSGEPFHFEAGSIFADQKNRDIAACAGRDQPTIGTKALDHGGFAAGEFPCATAFFSYAFNVIWPVARGLVERHRKDAFT